MGRNDTAVRVTRDSAGDYVVPDKVWDDAGIAEGTDLIAYVVGPGQIVIETHTAGPRPGLSGQTKPVSGVAFHV